MTPIPLGIVGSARSSAGYLAKCVELGALTVQDGFNDALTESAYPKAGTVVSVGTDPYGHEALLSANNSCLKGSIVRESTPYTLVGATSLVDGASSDFCRLVIFDAGFLGRQAARSSTSVARHTFAADAGTWHWFAFTVDTAIPDETTTVYRDGVPYGSPITRGDATQSVGTKAFEFGGISTMADRAIGHFSACAIFDSALSPQEIADLYAAYQGGL